MKRNYHQIRKKTTKKIKALINQTMIKINLKLMQKEQIIIEKRKMTTKRNNHQIRRKTTLKINVYKNQTKKKENHLTRRKTTKMIKFLTKRILKSKQDYQIKRLMKNLNTTMTNRIVIRKTITIKKTKETKS